MERLADLPEERLHPMSEKEIWGNGGSALSSLQFQLSS